MIRDYHKDLQSNLAPFISLQQLARDYDIQVNLTVADYLSEFLKFYPDRKEDVLQIIYILLRKSSRERRVISEKTLKTLKTYVQLYPQNKLEIISNLKRFFKKTSDPLLESTIQDLE